MSSVKRLLQTLSVFVIIFSSRAQTATNIHLRIELRTNGMDLVVDGAAETGELFVYQAPQAPDLFSRWTDFTIAIQTNTPLVHGLRFGLRNPGVSLASGFFKAVHFPGMVLIPAGPFSMGDALGDAAFSTWGERPVHIVQVSGFLMDIYDVTKAGWDDVYTWAIAHGYSFEVNAQGKAANHPAQSMTWYDAVKWCNARSEKEGRVPAYYTDDAHTAVYRMGSIDLQNEWVTWDAGYRLPTEAEWEKAARGGLSGHRFSLGDTISQQDANYFACPTCYTYDLGAAGYHPTFNDGIEPYTSPVGAFPPNGYGLYDMVGTWTNGVGIGKPCVLWLVAAG